MLLYAIIRYYASALSCIIFFFFFNDTATTEIYTLSLHDALPIYNRPLLVMRSNLWASGYDVDGTDQTSLGQFHQHHRDRKSGSAGMPRPISYAVFCLKKKKNVSQYTIKPLILNHSCIFTYVIFLY